MGHRNPQVHKGATNANSDELSCHVTDGQKKPRRGGGGHVMVRLLSPGLLQGHPSRWSYRIRAPLWLRLSSGPPQQGTHPFQVQMQQSSLISAVNQEVSHAPSRGTEQHLYADAQQESHATMVIADDIGTLEPHPCAACSFPSSVSNAQVYLATMRSRSRRTSWSEGCCVKALLPKALGTTPRLSEAVSQTSLPRPEPNLPP